MSGLTQRRKGGGGFSTYATETSNGGSYDDEYSPRSPQAGSLREPSGSGGNSANNSIENVHDESGFKADEDGYTEQDMAGKKAKLTLMEELLLIGLKDEQGYLSFWNDNLSYVLRGCILMELAMRKRIACFKEPGGRHLRKAFSDRLIDVIDDTPTGEVLLDEALKIMKSEQSPNSGGSIVRQSIADWVDLLSGETWNVLKISYQMKQVRERLAKGLVDKGVLRTEKKNFLIFEMPTHPVSDASVKKEIVGRVVDALLNRGPAPTRRTIALSCAAYVGNVMDNALNAVAKSGGLNLSFSQKDSCFAKCEDMLLEWSGSAQKGPGDRSEGLAHGVAKTSQEKEKLGWNDVLTGVIAVYLKMDSVL